MPRRFFFYFLLAVLLVPAVFICPLANAADPINFWNLDKLLSIPAQEIELTNDQGKTLGKIQYERLLVLNEVRRRIGNSSGIKSDCYVVTGDKPNAFATNVATGRNLFAINLPMLEELGTDADALAVLMGHEIAHIERNHIRQNMEKTKDIQTGNQIVGAILGAIIPGGGLISALGAQAIYTSYSRDHEREADSYGLEFARKAGFNPYGGVRLFTIISEKNGDKWATFLSTHPSSSERVQVIRESIASSPTGSTMSETQITVLDLPIAPQAEAHAVAVGEYTATVFDSEERAPTLHQKILCKLPDGSEVRTTRVDCIQQEGSFKP